MGASPKRKWTLWSRGRQRYGEHLARESELMGLSKEKTREIRDDLDKFQVVMIDNVLESAAGTNVNDLEGVKLPWPDAWIESGAKDVFVKGLRFGAITRELNRRECDVHPNFHGRSDYARRLNLWLPDRSWTSCIVLSIYAGTKRWIVHFSDVFVCIKDGRIYHPGEDGIVMLTDQDPGGETESLSREARFQWVQFITGSILFSLALVNCKNVVTEDHNHEPLTPNKKNRHKTPEAKFTYKVLRLDGSTLRRGAIAEGRDPNAAPPRYHICRGHFADHTKKGLFGKESLKGTFWVPMHTRGSKKAGTVRKIYEVDA